MKTDSELQRDVLAELDWDPAINASAIGVAVNNGIVTLTGHIETFAEKHAAARAVRRVAGVKAIALELDVRLAPEHRRSDTDIAAGIEHTLKWNTLLPAASIRPVVDHGMVTLRGEVEWDFQRRAAEKAVRSLTGVVAVSNEITLRVKPSVENVSKKIAEALARQASREARRVHVSLDGTTVRLTGTVHSWQERDAAQGVAWTAPGVRAVINELAVE